MSILLKEDVGASFCQVSPVTHSYLAFGVSHFILFVFQVSI